MAKTLRPDSVFINCPFDENYWPLFEVVIFTVIACGFRPRSALEASDSGDVRLEKIVRLIRESRFGIHDISRVELDPHNALPRFNMPFELGLDIGCRRYGSNQASKRILILDGEAYRYQKCLSDISGQDIRCHQNDPDRVLKHVRDWLNTESGRARLPGDQTIRKLFASFSDGLPEICSQGGLNRNSLSYADYVGFANEWLAQELGS